MKKAEKGSRRWAPIVKGRKTARPQVTGWVEQFRTPQGVWVTVPGASRFVAGAAKPE